MYVLCKLHYSLSTNSRSFNPPVPTRSSFTFLFFFYKLKVMIEDFKERLVLTELHQDEKRVKIAFIAIGILLIILLFTVSYLILLSVNNQNQKDANKIMMNEQIIVTSVPTPIISSNPMLTTTPSPTTAVVSKETTTQNVKEYFIPFGSGTNQTADWADVVGMQASIDFGNYQNIKEIRFEASVNVPTGNETVWVRLFNVSDKHPVWYSEVTTVNNSYIVSQPIVYDKGSKIYQVQMKTQLQYTANLTQARIHIILQ